jgi:hypothetical protein
MCRRSCNYLIADKAVPVFWGHRLADGGRRLAEDLVLLLQVADLLPRRDEFRGLRPAGPGLQPAVDAVLLLPPVQARLGDPEQLRDLRDGPARTDQVQRPLPELRRSGLGQCGSGAPSGTGGVSDT